MTEFCYMRRDVGIVRQVILPLMMYPVLVAGIVFLTAVIWLNERKKRWLG